MVDPTVTGIVNDPSAVGVPLAFKTMACAPVPRESSRCAECNSINGCRNNGICAHSGYVYIFTVAVFKELVATPAAYVPLR